MFQLLKFSESYLWTEKQSLFQSTSRTGKDTNTPSATSAPLWMTSPFAHISLPSHLISRRTVIHCVFLGAFLFLASFTHFPSHHPVLYRFFCTQPHSTTSFLATLLRLAFQVWLMFLMNTALSGFNRTPPLSSSQSCLAAHFLHNTCFSKVSWTHHPHANRHLFIKEYLGPVSRNCQLPRALSPASNL